MNAIVPAGRESPYRPIVKLVTDRAGSIHTSRAYDRALTDFMTWLDAQGRPQLTKAVVQAYVASLRDAGVSASSINQRLVAIRALVHEAADNELMPQEAATAIAKVKGVKQRGRRLGNWLTLQQAQTLVNAPSPSTKAGLRDRAVLAICIGCGLRRAEIVSLQTSQLQHRDGRPVIVDLVGKGNRHRSVPIPAWTWTAMQDWIAAAGIESGPIFRRLTSNQRLGGTFTPQAVYLIIARHAKASLNLDLAPHDLRRTFAYLSRQAGAPLEQIQMVLGHASIVTTERYLGSAQDMRQSPGDLIAINLQT